MAAAEPDPGFTSLAQHLAAVREGDPCPCCGGPLGADAARSGLGTGQPGEDLGCHDCGFRLSADDAEWGRLRRLAYCLAA